VSGTGHGVCVVQSEVVGGPGDELPHLFVERHNGCLGHAIERGLHAVTGGEVANDVGEVLFGGAHPLVDGVARVDCQRCGVGDDIGSQRLRQPLSASAEVWIPGVLLGRSCCVDAISTERLGTCAGGPVTAPQARRATTPSGMPRGAVAHLAQLGTSAASTSAPFYEKKQVSLRSHWRFGSERRARSSAASS
jgi:hypothetical protein